MIRKVSWLKYHLAKILGHDVGICGESTLEIMQVSHDSIYEEDRQREEAIANKDEVSTNGMTSR